jgi:hypothetical protein
MQINKSVLLCIPNLVQLQRVSQHVVKACSRFLVIINLLVYAYESCNVSFYHPPLWFQTSCRTHLPTIRPIVVVVNCHLLPKCLHMVCKICRKLWQYRISSSLTKFLPRFGLWDAICTIITPWPSSGEVFYGLQRLLQIGGQHPRTNATSKLR